MQALVIGANGFLGSHLINRLLTRGFRVRAYERRPVNRNDKVEWLTGQLHEQGRLLNALKGVDHVFHFAWTTVPQTSNENPHWDVQSNVTASLQLLEACSDAGIRSVIFPSSGGTVYGVTDRDELDEQSPTEPICSYGITKLMVEKYLALYRRTRGLDFRVLRIANAYGEEQRLDRPQGLIGVALSKIVRGDSITIWGDGTAVRDYIYASDVVECCIDAALMPLSQEMPRVFNVSSGQGYSIRDVMRAVEEVTGCHLHLTYAPARSCDVNRMVLSNQRSAEVLGWSPKVRLQDGLARTWDWAYNAYKIEAVA